MDQNDSSQVYVASKELGVFSKGKKLGLRTVAVYFQGWKLIGVVDALVIKKHFHSSYHRPSTVSSSCAIGAPGFCMARTSVSQITACCSTRHP
jgi:hypothetical protein